MKCAEPDQEKLREIYETLEFRSFIRKMDTTQTDASNLLTAWVRSLANLRTTCKAV